jgi:outer membrane receptor for ferrienterochelin and colicins
MMRLCRNRTPSAHAAYVFLSMLAASGASAQTASPAPEPQRVEVTGNLGTQRPGALRADIVQTESFGEKAIERSGATNINEALDKNPGIAVQVECSICNVRNVLLNNLPGRYTTLLIDGVPIYSSVSSAYGLDSVSVWGVERIDVARGAGASLIAPEALSGTVNIITKRPKDSGVRLRGQIGNFGSRQADIYGARAFDGGALTVTGSINRHDSVDGNGDRVSEYTGYDRKMAGVGLFLDDLGGFKLRGRLDVVDEKRGGGALGRDYAAIKASLTGNPFDWSRGVGGSPDPSGWINPADNTLLPYDGGRGGFSEIIFTDRQQVIGIAERTLGASKLRLALGLARHEQDSFYEGADYDAKQDQRYVEASLRFPLGDWALTTGLNHRYEDLKSQGVTAGGDVVDGIDNYVYRVPGVFFQAYRTFFDDALEVNGSLRHDRHNVFGNITSPRLNLLWHHTPQLSSRFSAGKGFRAPTSFFEQDHGILDTLRIVRQIDKPEVSNNLSYALSYEESRFAATASVHHNRIKNFAILDPGATDPVTGDPITIFTSATKPVTVQGADINMTWQATPALAVSAAAEVYRYRFEAGTLIFARPKHRAFLSFDYDAGGFDLTAKLSYTGPMDLRRFHDDGSGAQNRFNLDGTPKRDRSPAFVTLDLRGEYALNKTVTLYGGVDNATDYKQVSKESPLFVDGDGAPDVVHLWGPNRGRYVYAGLKLSF